MAIHVRCSSLDIEQGQNTAKVKSPNPSVLDYWGGHVSLYQGAKSPCSQLNGRGTKSKYWGRINCSCEFFCVCLQWFMHFFRLLGILRLLFLFFPSEMPSNIDFVTHWVTPDKYLRKHLWSCSKSKRELNFLGILFLFSHSFCVVARAN